MNVFRRQGVIIKKKLPVRAERQKKDNHRESWESDSAGIIRPLFHIRQKSDATRLNLTVLWTRKSKNRVDLGPPFLFRSEGPEKHGPESSLARSLLPFPENWKYN